MFGLSRPKANDKRPIKDVRVSLIEDSGLFDKSYYLAHYPDVADRRQCPIHDYIESGASHGRNPSADFDTIWYVSENSDAAKMNPLIHYIQYGRSYNASTLPLNDLQKLESFERAVQSGRLDGTRLYKGIEGIDVPLPSGDVAHPNTDFPAPPLALASRVGSDDLDGFHRIGRIVKTQIVRCLDEGFSFDGARCLDFGCGAGRIIRHFASEARQGEFWGCDIDSTSVLWCATHVNPPFRFFQLSDAPILPFESSSFDLVYAVAVFSQVFRDWNTWAMEIRRILKPGGVFFMSFNGQYPFEAHYTNGQSYDDYTRNNGMCIQGPYAPWNQGGPNVTFSHDWLKRIWGAMFDIEFIAPEGLDDFQSICLMKKPAALAPPRGEVPILRLYTTQDYDPDAVGKIFPQFDETKSFREAFGIEAGRQFDARGWIAFRTDTPAYLEAYIDGHRIDATTTFTASDKHHDWDVDRYLLTARCDAGGFGTGRYRLDLIVVGNAGRSHKMSMPILFS